MLPHKVKNSVPKKYETADDQPISGLDADETWVIGTLNEQYNTNCNTKIRSEEAQGGLDMGARSEADTEP